MRETVIQRKVMAYLRGNGFMVFKLPAVYCRGVPDLLAVKDGKAYFLEIKKPGGKATALQLKIIEQLRQHGAVAGVVESVDEVALLLFS